MPGGKDEEGRKKHPWRPVGPSIWLPGSHPRKLKRIWERITELMAPFFFGAMVILGPLSVLISLLLVYPLVSLQFFGMTLVAFWAVLIVAFVLIAEKTGYARNFEGRNFPLRRMGAVPIAFLFVLGLILLLYALSPAHLGMP